MTSDKQLFALVLEYIEANADSQDEWDMVAALKERLEQPEQEPVANDWSVFNTGAEVWSGLSMEDAVAELTPERLERGWSAVCVIDKDNPPIYTTPPAAPVACVACEGNPKGENIPCAVCGATPPAAPVQEPVKLVAYNCKCGRAMKFESVNGVVAAQRQWVGLDDDEMLMLYGQDHVGKKYNLGRMVEAKLKEKNT